MSQSTSQAPSGAPSMVHSEGVSEGAPMPSESFGAPSPGGAGMDGGSNAASRALRTPSSMGNGRRTHSSRRRIHGTTPRTGQYALLNLRRASSGVAPTPTHGGTQEVSESRDANNQRIWGTNIEAAETEQRFIRFLRNFSTSEGINIYMQLIEEMVANNITSMRLDCCDVEVYDPELHEQLVLYPTEAVMLFDQGLATVAVSLGMDQDGAAAAQIHPYNLRKSQPMRDINPSDIDTMVSIKGMVTRTSGIIPEMIGAVFSCEVCRTEANVGVDMGKVEEPTMCTHCHNKFTMRLQHNRSDFSNKQMIKLQESPDQIPEGETPHTCTLFAYDNSVDTCKPGDRVTVTGIFKATPVRVNPKNRSVKSIYKTYIQVTHIDVEHNSSVGSGIAAADSQSASEETQQEDSAAARAAEKMKEMGALPDIYDQLADSLAPSVYGMEDVKRGILCQLFGGVRKEFSGGLTRGELNVLMVGDPGVSKSQLLSYVHKIAPRGIYTSGRGSSAVGLTAYVTKDPETREMVLESGALVLSDLGICCIDEFDKMSDNARSMLHEVMEQQTVSVAKAGIISTLNARTSVLAAANPKESKYDKDKSISDNINLPPSLISRFDLLYLVLDAADEKHDHRLARHLVSMHFANPPEKASAKISAKDMREFIAYARQECQPQLSDEAAQKLVQGYIDLRNQGSATASQRTRITATPRQLESLIRISEALARMRLSSTVLASDVEEAMRLMKSAWLSSAIDPTTGNLDMSLINTGISASTREMHRMLPQEIQRLINEMDTGNGTIQQLLEKLHQQTSAPVTFENVVTAMESLPTIMVTGQNWRKQQ